MSVGRVHVARLRLHQFCVAVRAGNLAVTYRVSLVDGMRAFTKARQSAVSDLEQVWILPHPVSTHGGFCLGNGDVVEFAEPRAVQVPDATL